MIRLTCFVLFICSTVSANLDDLVPTSLGVVRGKLVHDEITSTSYWTYLGIPYAEAPCGELRFKPQVPKKPWKDIRDATKPGRVCPQREGYHTRDQMSEDCLFLNVYVPANRTKELMPVLFHMHAGNFDSQSGNPEPIYGPQLFLRQNIVVVTINYRIGALGFLSLCHDQISGNCGLKDIVLALKIIYQNIKRFGGDPNKITLNGVEASAAICGYLMLIPETKNLFNNVIMHSGSVLSPKYEQFTPKQNALSLARELNLKHRNIGELIEKFKSANPFDIVKATETMIMKDPQRGLRIYNPFMPTVETPCKHAVVKESMLKMIRKGCLHDKPILCGFNNQEGLDVFIQTLKKAPNLINNFNENRILVAPAELQYPKGSKALKEVAERIWNFYFSCNNMSIVTTQNFVSYVSDWQYNNGMDWFVRLFIETKKSPAYYFMYGPDTELNWAKISGGISYPGCASSDGIGYEFITKVTKPKYKCLSPTAKKVQEFVLKAIYDFMKSGKPSDLPEPWPSARPNRYHVAVCNSGHEIVRHAPYPGRMAFWQSIYKDFFNYKESVGSFYCTNDDNHSVQ